MAIQIRMAAPSDAEALAELGERTFREAFGAQNTPQDMAAYVRANFSVALQADELKDPSLVLLLAEQGFDAVGYAKLRQGGAPPCVTGPEPVELSRLYVAAQWQREGVGRLLLENGLTLARAWGGQTLWLGVWEHNLRARAFYRREGFAVVGQHTFHLGSDAQTDLIMSRTL